MIKEIYIILSPEFAFDNTHILQEASRKLKTPVDQITAAVPIRRSIDARRKPVYKIQLKVYINEQPQSERIKVEYNPVSSSKKVIIVGCGPAGMFAALRAIELNIKPIIIERGKDVQARRRDLRAIQQLHNVNPDSNYCFGEGGAGAYSDGKLYTRSTKRGNVKKILGILVQHGAQNEILIDAHPHIGSNRLPDVVKSIRETIINCGGEVNFNSKVVDLILNDELAKGVVDQNNNEYTGDAVIIAAGHSSRDIFELFHKKKLRIDPKPFAIGVRIEHPQPLINEIQYHTQQKNENLPAASYSLACQVEGRGVYSFCMCPGGIIVPAATAPGEIVVNGMSLSRRDSPFANSGFVVSVDEKDWKKYDDFYPFSSLMLQQEVERLAFDLANKSQSAPSQRAVDFVEGKSSSTLPDTSYIPGLTSAALHKELPGFIKIPLKKALIIFNKKMRGYYTNEAQIVASESRTSSPIRIPRDSDSYMHPDAAGLIPCGEGAGYAGGIISAAIDGENCADAALRFINV